MTSHNWIPSGASCIFSARVLWGEKRKKKMKSDYFMLMHATRSEQDPYGPHGGTQGLICESIHITKDSGGVSLLLRNTAPLDEVLTALSARDSELQLLHKGNTLSEILETDGRKITWLILGLRNLNLKAIDTGNEKNSNL